MGATASSNGVPSPSAPPRERDEETFVRGTEESCCPEYTNENIRQRRRTSVFDGPSPYATFRGEEWWNQRPSAPSLSNLQPPRETLLTYAAQMTGWQSAEGHSPLFSQHQEAMELSRVISQLAMANQQLATAHAATLGHLEALYVELRKEREARRRAASSETLDVPLKKKLTIEQEDEDEEDGKRRMETRIDRLEEKLLTDSDTCQGRQRNFCQNEERKLWTRIERLETMMKNRCRNDPTENWDSSNHRQTMEVGCDKLSYSTDVPEEEFRRTSDKDLRVENQRRDSSSNDQMDHASVNLHLNKSEDEQCTMKSDEDRRVLREETIRLSEEVERLKAERLEYQSLNERLEKELMAEKSLASKLKKDCEESKMRHEELESSLQERREEYDKLMEKFDVAKKETERLLEEIDKFNSQKDTDEARIYSLEQDLQKSLLEKEQIKSIESQKTLKLKAQLSEEVSDKKKQIKALEDALDEIQRLKETIKTEKQSDDDDASKEDIGPLEPTDGSQGNASTERATNLEEFKKELTLKREARQRAIAAVSSEMERLRRELDAEKEAHSETSRVLDLLRSAQNDSQAEGQRNVDESLKRSRIRDQKPDEQEVITKRVEAQRLSNILKVSDELRNDIRLQIDKMDDLRYQLETEPDHHRYRIRSLAELTNKTREALHSREHRANELKDHLAQILVRLGDRSFLDLKDDVGLECERQLENIDSLKCLYNARLKVLSELKEAAIRELMDVKERLDHAVKKSESLEEDLRKADEKIDAQDTEITNLESQLGLTKADCRDLQNQMSVINGLFTQMLLGASSADMDLDRLTQLLQENHDLICDMAREEGTEAAALPKLLLDIIEQVEGSKGAQKRTDSENSGSEVEAEKREEDLQQEDIAHNLPKVWRVLLELLSCHAEGTPSASAASSSDPNSCYKSVDTPAGPRLVISVSKTYIRLKELILEKKHLEKEMNRMKQLNAHLESKLGEQEKRLSAVSAELSKTWTIVDRMQAQHHQLHTHEKILRYELQQKRKMLQELKQELEYCREKWESARQKNTNTELEWRSLRREFAARKALAAHDSFNNSAESGFSDERGDDTDEEEDNSVEERIRLGPRRRPRKESPRAPTPDTESEQPTDTELSESKTGSSATLEQRTPTPETEAELDDSEVIDSATISELPNITDKSLILKSSQESLNPLDQALTNVIQNLIAIDDVSSSSSSTFKDQSEPLKIIPEESAIVSEDPQTCQFNLESTIQSTDLEPSNEVKNDLKDVCKVSEEDLPVSTVTEDPKSPSNTDGEKEKSEDPLKSSVSHVPTVTSPASTQSVFSIGPFPLSIVTMKNVQFTEPPIVNQFFAPVFGAPLTENRFDPPSSSNQDANLKEKRVTKSTDCAVDCDSVSVDSSSSMETVKEFSIIETPIANETKPEMSLQEPSGSRQEEKKTVKTRTPEEVIAAREDRLKRLEEQAKWLMNKMNATNRRGSALSTRLEELHEVYREPPVPPPMPDVLPSRRLRTNLEDLSPQVPESSFTEGTINTEQSLSSSASNQSP
ncbi:golgin subfamily B member 1 isoform X2 [Osmia bicornis bicornis]|uniref:golgin subfamily B member 1 isoform X2 n=1 Tax=Osmia bicornis bicornis TaxID=1437191 RepID=UPI001EAF677B|nr:golgin subfamily B member 1 isoform X2 [Osmia bicornis bicornis]